jgi:hypothetical protein
MVCPLKHVRAQNATSLVLMPKTLQGFGNVIDVDKIHTMGNCGRIH